MDRRQRKTRKLIFKAFIDLLSEKRYEQITVGEIICRADVGRATFYAHFETKDFLLKEICEELFGHIFQAKTGNNAQSYIFNCEAPDSVFLHLFQHLQKNDNNITKLLTSENNELFLKYFKLNLTVLIKDNISMFDTKKAENLPEDFWIRHISGVFVETLSWWIDNNMEELPETITEYFFTAV